MEGPNLGKGGAESGDKKHGREGVVINASHTFAPETVFQILCRVQVLVVSEGRTMRTGLGAVPPQIENYVTHPFSLSNRSFVNMAYIWKRDSWKRQTRSLTLKAV